VTIEKYGYGQNARKLVATFERGDLISIREHRRRAAFNARIYDVYCWMLRSHADKIRMEKLRASAKQQKRRDEPHDDRRFISVAATKTRFCLLPFSFLKGRQSSSDV
jgi:hypothetical protein